MNKKDLMAFYMDIFKTEEEEKAKQNLKIVDNQNKNISIKEEQQDLKEIDFKQIF